MENTKEKQNENVLLFPNSNWALFNSNVRQRIQSEVTRSSGIEAPQVEHIVSGVESALCKEIIGISRRFFAKLGENVVKKMFD